MNKLNHYIDVIWHHESLDDPIRLVSELDPNRFELRKLEFFRDGTVGVADCDRETSQTRLGIVAIPSLDEINQDRQFVATSINREVFEHLWFRHA